RPGATVPGSPAASPVEVTRDGWLTTRPFTSDSTARPPRDRSSGANLWPIVVAALLLAWLGVLLECVYIGLWPISYDLTQGSDFSYEYLLQYPQVWDWFRPMLTRFEGLFTTAATSLEQLTSLLSAFWIASFLLYFSAFL